MLEMFNEIITKFSGDTYSMEALIPSLVVVGGGLFMIIGSFVTARVLMNKDPQ